MARKKKDITDKNRNLVETLYSKHDKWVNLIKKLDRKYSYPEDVVSEWYIEMMRYGTDNFIKADGEINEAYAYVSLRNYFYHIVKKEGKVHYVELEEKHFNEEDLPDLEREAYDKVCARVEEVTSEWEWYDKKLFDIYFTSGMSFRQMGKEIGISWVSIYHNIKDSKEKLKQAMYEDYADYINGDYDLI